jgi:alpha-tubulin suppressor-like RCC1 family protein
MNQILYVAVLTAAKLLLFATCVASTQARDVFSFGLNPLGQLGRDTADGTGLIATQIDASNLPGLAIVHVAAGSSHSLLLADNGTVFSFGDNSDGQLGLGALSGDVPIATAIDMSSLAGKMITQVAAGSLHSLLLADDGSVFSFGSNLLGQAGLGNLVDDTPVATPIIDIGLAGKAITQVAAGGRHSLLLADDGSVFSFGRNLDAQLGLGFAGVEVPIAIPIDMTNLPGKTITQLAAGNSHSLLLADDGTVFSFGSNSNGRTGNGTTTFWTLRATPIDMTNVAGKTITQIAAGGGHSLLLADDGSVFSFGANNLGQLGLGPSSDNALIATPIDMTNLGGKTITQVAAGGNFSLLLADDGTVFFFGLNEFIPPRPPGLPGPITYIATPIDMTNLGGLRVTQIAAGNFHSLLIAVPEPGTFALAGLALLGGRPKRTRSATRRYCAGDGLTAARS